MHRYAGILSAYGLVLADVVVENQEPCIKIFSESFFFIIKFCDLIKLNQFFRFQAFHYHQ